MVSHILGGTLEDPHLAQARTNEHMPLYSFRVSSNNEINLNNFDQPKTNLFHLFDGITFIDIFTNFTGKVNNQNHKMV